MNQELKLMNHCQNKTCFNFTSKTDLSGSWCQDECFFKGEFDQTITHLELLEMKVDYDWTLDEFEKIEIKKYCIVKSQKRIEQD